MIAVAGGIESISLVQNEQMNKFHTVDDELMAIMAMKPAMLETAEMVAERYKISRERQDKYSLECQRRTASALQGRRAGDPLTEMFGIRHPIMSVIPFDSIVSADDRSERFFGA